MILKGRPFMAMNPEKRWRGGKGAFINIESRACLMLATSADSTKVERVDK